MRIPSLTGLARISGSTRRHFARQSSLAFSRSYLRMRQEKRCTVHIRSAWHVPAMMIGHLTVFGAAEVIFTVAVLAFMKKAAPDTAYVKKSHAVRPVYLLLTALIVLTPLGLLATGTAWGEWGMDEIAEVVSGGKALGYTPAGMADGMDFSALFPDYTVAGMPEWLGYILSAVIGAALDDHYF